MKEKLLRMAELIDTLEPDEGLCWICKTYIDCFYRRMCDSGGSSSDIAFCSDFEEENE